MQMQTVKNTLNKIGDLRIRDLFRIVPAASSAVSKRVDVKSFVLGIVVSVSFIGLQPRQAEAIDFNAIARSVSNLIKIKKSLDGDVRNLTADAKMLFGDKDNMIQIKDQLIRLSTETKAQIDTITTLVGVVEGHIKKTQEDIQKTSNHVKEIDDVRKALEGK